MKPLNGEFMLMVTTSKPGSRRPPLGTERSVAIIGAGAAGISAAHYLRQKGYRQITLIDRRARVGGKCLTQTIDGRNYELGALVVGNTYDCVRGLIDDAGLTTAPFDPFRILDTQQPQYYIRADQHYARSKAAMVRVLATYLKHCRQLSRPGYVGLEKAALSGCTMDQWLHKHRLAHLKSLLAPYYVNWGYGYLEQVSAVYVFKVLDFYTRTLARIYLMPHKNHPASYLMEGYQTLFEIIAEPFELISSVDIKRIERRGGVTIEFDGQKRSFDALILACPFQNTLGFLDADTREKRLFTKIKILHFYTVTASVKGVPPDHLIFVLNHLVSHQSGRVVSWYRRWPDRDIVVFYLLSHHTQSMDQMVAGLRHDLAKIGATIQKIYDSDHWCYFPHVAPTEIANGYYREFEKMQGQRHTWYTGELLAFSTVEHVVAYSRHLVERNF